MLHNLLVRACRFYQFLFSGNHPGEKRLGELYDSERQAFQVEQLQYGLEKGTRFLTRFAAFSDGWSNAKVLDFGCGGGGLTCQLGTRFREVWGLDVGKEELASAEEEAARRGYRNVQFVCYDGNQLPFADASFDCVFSVDVIEHLPTPDRFIREWERVLKPGGQVLLSFGPPWRHAHGKHMWSKLPGWWTHLLFPRSVVMEVRGLDPKTTWEEIGLHRLTVSAFESVMAHSKLETVFIDYKIKGALYPLKWVPVLREFFISEVTAVLKKPCRL